MTKTCHKPQLVTGQSIPALDAILPSERWQVTCGPHPRIIEASDET